MLRTLQLAYRIKQRRPKQQQANRSATLAVSRLSHFGRFRGYRTLGGFAAIAPWAVSRLSHFYDVVKRLVILARAPVQAVATLVQAVTVLDTHGLGPRPAGGCSLHGRPAAVHCTAGSRPARGPHAAPVQMAAPRALSALIVAP